MAYTLVIGNKNYSSWSMRAWLLLRLVEASFTERVVSLYTATARAEVQALGGQTGLVPVLKDADLVIWDTLAIAEYLYESYPQLWPKDKVARARARSLCAEVHAGLNALRSAMPVNTRARKRTAKVTEDVAADIERVKVIWAECLDAYGGPWLFGDYSAADVFFAPVATRFQTYGVELEGRPLEYYRRILGHPQVVEWLMAGGAEADFIERFDKMGMP